MDGQSLTADWLDPTASISNGLLTSRNSAFYSCYPSWSYTQPAPKIQLTMSEIERLRAVAKDDKKVRAILAKFTNSIEIVVDFGE